MKCEQEGDDGNNNKANQYFAIYKMVWGNFWEFAKNNERIVENFEEIFEKMSWKF